MKILYMHAKNLVIETVVPGRTPSRRRRAEKRMRATLGALLPEVDMGNRRTEAANALLTFVCVERGDESVDLKKVKADIMRSRALLGAAEIVIGAFAHMSNNVADAMLARRIVDDLAELVSRDHHPTKTYPFGWDKSIDMHVPAHHYNVAFRSFEPAIIV